MFVVKRDGRKEPVHFDKITARITKLSYGLNSDFCDPVRGTALVNRDPTDDGHPNPSRASISPSQSTPSGRRSSWPRK